MTKFAVKNVMYSMYCCKSPHPGNVEGISACACLHLQLAALKGCSVERRTISCGGLPVRIPCMARLKDGINRMRGLPGPVHVSRSDVCKFWLQRGQPGGMQRSLHRGRGGCYSTTQSSARNAPCGRPWPPGGAMCRAGGFSGCSSREWWTGRGCSFCAAPSAAGKKPRQHAGCRG